MKAQVSIEVKPFTTPNFVLVVTEQGEAMQTSVKLCQIDESTLSMLCDGFRAEIFKKAGKKDPRLV